MGSFHAQLIHLKKFEKAEDQILSMIESLGEQETWVFFSQVFLHRYHAQKIEKSPLYKDIDLKALNKEFNEYVGDKSKSTIFSPFKVSLQCKLMQKVLLLVTAEDPAETIMFHRLQIALMYLYNKERGHREIKDTEMRPLAVR